MHGDLLQRLLETTSTTEYVSVAADGRIVAVNGAFARHVGRSSDQLVGEPLAEFLTATDASRLRGWLDGDAIPDERESINFVTASGEPFTLLCLIDREDGHLTLLGEPDTSGDRTAAEELMRLNNELATVARERARRERELERTRRELEAAIEELETSYWHLKKIQEVLPLCMRCGKVKTDEARWQTVAEYLKENEIFLSHGYCPGCTELVFREHGLAEESPV